MSEKKCVNCGNVNPGSIYFCKKCGSFLDAESYESKKSYERSEILMKRIVENLQRNPHYDILWSDVADLYMRKVERLNNLLRIKELGADNQTLVFQKMQDFMELCRNHEFQIAFVGTIKTGKSTLINALLGKNYASMAVTPETAALTKFRRSERDYVKVTFYKHDEWEKLWNSRTSGATDFMREYTDLNAEAHKDKWVGHTVHMRWLSNNDIKDELAVWSSSKHPEHYFVKEIEVGISTLPDSFPNNVVFVDTPGLSDPVAYRSEITKEYIRKANAVFVCVDAKKIEKTEIETIASVFSFTSSSSQDKENNKRKVHIIATHWDEMNQPDIDWPQSKAFMIKRLVGPGFFENSEMASENILYSSAYLYNLCRDYRHLEARETFYINSFALKYFYNEPDIFNLIQNNPEEIKDRVSTITNIEAIQKVVNGKLLANYESMLNGDIEKKYRDVMFQIRRHTDERRNAMADLISASQSDIGEMQKRLTTEEENIAEIERCKQQLNALMKDVNQRTQSRLDRLMPVLDDLIKDVGKKTKKK